MPLGASTRARYRPTSRPTTTEDERIKALEREVRELRKTNKILRPGECVFRPSGAGPPLQVERKFVDQYRHAWVSSHLQVNAGCSVGLLGLIYIASTACRLMRSNQGLLS
jgi:hypothetical protein